VKRSVKPEALDKLVSHTCRLLGVTRTQISGSMPNTHLSAMCKGTRTVSADRAQQLKETFEHLLDEFSEIGPFPNDLQFEIERYLEDLLSHTFKE